MKKIGTLTIQAIAGIFLLVIVLVVMFGFAFQIPGFGGKFFGAIGEQLADVSAGVWSFLGGLFKSIAQALATAWKKGIALAAIFGVGSGIRLLYYSRFVFGKPAVVGRAMWKPILKSLLYKSTWKSIFSWSTLKAFGRMMSTRMGWKFALKSLKGGLTALGIGIAIELACVANACGAIDSATGINGLGRGLATGAQFALLGAAIAGPLAPIGAGIGFAVGLAVGFFIGF